MSVWGWYRDRRWWTQVPLGLLGGLVLAAVLYIAVRSLQFLVAEKEAGLYLPATAQVVLRAKNLGRHLERLKSTGAWRVIRGRLLKDPAIRPAINQALVEAGAPTLDDLWDERNSDVYSTDLLVRAAGRDAAAALEVRDGRGPVRWFAVTRVRWSDYLLLPLARLVFPAENVDGTAAVRLPGGKPETFVAFEGRLALVSNDRALLAQGLLRKGSESADDHPLTARVEFGGSAVLRRIRGTLGDSGVFSMIRTDSVRAVEMAVDLDSTAARLEVRLEGAEATRPEAAAPQALLRLAPEGATGALTSATGPQELFDRLHSLVGAPAPPDPMMKNLKEALQALDEVGFSSEFLPNLDGGMVVLTGAEDGEQDNRVYPTLAILVSSRDPAKAVETLSHEIRVLGGNMANQNFNSMRVGDALLWSFRWPESAQANDFFRPCFAALPGVFVFGNNLRFTQSILEQAARGGSEPVERVPAKKLREYGIAPAPALAGGYLLLPALRESLDGPIPHVAKYMVTATVSFPQLRAQIEAELRQERRSFTNKQAEDLFKVRVAQLERAKEDELRASLHALDYMKWVAFSIEPAGKGAWLRAAIEFK